MESHQTLEGLFPDLGIETLFSPQCCDLGGMATSVKPGDLYISRVFHAVFLEVDEQGTEAAAAAAFGGDLLGFDPRIPPTIRFDSPFLCLIRHRPSQAILLAGWIEDPRG